jgi:hypothetical protein
MLKILRPPLLAWITVVLAAMAGWYAYQASPEGIYLYTPRDWTTSASKSPSSAAASVTRLVPPRSCWLDEPPRLPRRTRARLLLTTKSHIYPRRSLTFTFVDSMLWKLARMNRLPGHCFVMHLRSGELDPESRSWSRAGRFSAASLAYGAHQRHRSRSAAESCGATSVFATSMILLASRTRSTTRRVPSDIDTPVACTSARSVPHAPAPSE